MTRHSEKIFRTVVFAGAMLGAPLVSADAPQQPTKAPSSKKVDTVESVTKEIAALDVEIQKATDAVSRAQSQADRDAAKVRLGHRQSQRADLEKKLVFVKKAAAKTPLEKLEAELFGLDLEVAAAVDAVAAAQNDADRKAAKAKLDALRRAKAELENKLAELKKPTAETPLHKLQQELAEIDRKVTTAIDVVMAAQNDAERAAAKAKLKPLQTQKADLEAKIAAEKAKLARPRTPENERPIGRGFVLA